MADSLSIDRPVLNKKIKWFFKMEGYLRDNLPHLKKNQKRKKNDGRLKNSLKKWPIFPLFFGSIKY